MASTIATDELEWLAAEWAKLYRSAKFSGIVGDAAHAARGGYHIGRAFQSKTNYSVTRADDKGGPSNAAAAIDMNLNQGDMVTLHVFLRGLFNAKDPRMKYINAWNGWDGKGGAGRYDVVAHEVDSATSDHKWHMHLEIRRKYVQDMTAMRAILSMFRRESLATYQKGLNAVPVAAKPVTKPVAAKPAPKPVVVENKAPKFPLAASAYFGKSTKYNANVKQAQRRLELRGWDLGKAGADGYFGDRTDEVVRQFQKEKHLTVDGKIGPATWRAIWEAPVK
jgi:hypothetical protein